MNYQSGLAVAALLCYIAGAAAMSSIQYQAVSCTSSQYYDISQLRCVACPTNTTAASSGFDCVCLQSFYYTKNFGGGEVTCAPCPSGYTASPDGWSCVRCAAGLAADGACTSCTSASSVQIARDILGNLLSPTTVNSKSYGLESCFSCASGTAPSVDGALCVPCGQTLSLSSGATSCSCSSPVGGICFPSSSLGYIPSQITYNVYKTDRQASVSPSIQSVWFTNNLLAAYGMCVTYHNSTACQSLGNMCVLLYSSRQNVGSSSSVIDACNLFQSAANALLVGANDINGWDQFMPWIWYDPTQQTSNFLLDALFTQTVSLNQYIDIRFAMYTLNGTFLGFSRIDSGVIQLCKQSPSEMNAAFFFGTYYSQSCTVTVDSLFNYNSPIFFDPYYYYSVNNQGQLFPIPVVLTNYYASSSYPNTAKYPSFSGWQLSRRFFLVDNVTPLSVTSTSATPSFVRYASSITLTMRMVTGTTTGAIYPPFLTVSYSDVDQTSFGQGQSVSVNFAVSYYYDSTTFEYQFSIAVGVMSALAAVWAIMRTWSWSKRAGKTSIDAISMLKFFAFSCSALANAFFFVSAGTSMYLTVFYKKQSVMYISMPTADQQEYVLAFLYAAFALKFVELVHLIVVQCSIDIFFMDWEKSRNQNRQQTISSGSAPQSTSSAATGDGRKTPKTDLPQVTVWRATFVANEFCELQLYRKIDLKWQLIVVLLALETIGFIYAATLDGNGNLSLASNGQYQAPFSPLFRYAIIVTVWIVWGICQWTFKTFFYDRSVEDKMGMFTDLCSVTNVSVFIMSARQFGYYIHGRSAHGHADASLKEMVEQLAKEEQGLVGHRGLEAGSDQQVYIMALPAAIRPAIDNAYIEITSHITEQTRTGAELQAEAGQSILSGHQLKMFEVYNRLNMHLQNFINHAMTRVADYQLRPRKLIEDMLDIESDTVTGTLGYFYPDPDGNAFNAIMFQGSEWTLFIFDLLLFCVVDALAGMDSVALDVFITFIVGQFYQHVRGNFGKKNVAKKTLIDDRFLA